MMLESFRKIVFRETWVWWILQFSIIKTRNLPKEALKFCKLEFGWVK